MLFSETFIQVATMVTFAFLVICILGSNSELIDVMGWVFLVGLVVCLVVWPFSGPTVHGTVTDFPTVETVVVEVYGFPILAELGEMESSAGDTAYVREEEDGWVVVKVVKERD